MPFPTRFTRVKKIPIRIMCYCWKRHGNAATALEMASIAGLAQHTHARKSTKGIWREEKQFVIFLALIQSPLNERKKTDQTNSTSIKWWISIHFRNSQIVRSVCGDVRALCECAHSTRWPGDIFCQNELRHLLKSSPRKKATTFLPEYFHLKKQQLWSLRCSVAHTNTSAHTRTISSFDVIGSSSLE